MTLTTMYFDNKSTGEALAAASAFNLPVTDILELLNIITGTKMEKFSNRAEAECEFCRIASYWEQSDLLGALAAVRERDNFGMERLLVTYLNSEFGTDWQVMAKKPLKEYAIPQNESTTITHERATNPRPVKHESVAEAVSDTWKNPDVRTARQTKSSVEVDGVEFGSVLKAFVALELPVPKHQKFRLALKASGSEVFQWEGKDYHFTIKG